MVASAVLNIQAEIESSRRRLHQVLQRLELAERSAAVRDEDNLDYISNIKSVDSTNKKNFIVLVTLDEEDDESGGWDGSVNRKDCF